MKNVFYTFVFLTAFGSIANAQRIYYSTKPVTGKKDIVSVEVPQGWVQQVIENSGLQAGQLLTKAEGANGSIIIQTIGIDDTYKTVEALLAHEKLMYNVKPATVHTLYPMALDKKKTQAELIHVTGSADGEQLVAFIPAKNGIVVVTMVAENDAFISEHKNDFEALLNSYQFNPIINPPSYAEITID